MPVSTILLWASILTGLLSGVFWLLSALISYPMGMTYLDGPPDDVRSKMSRQAKYNGIAAGLAAMTALFQALTTFCSKPLQ